MATVAQSRACDRQRRSCCPCQRAVHRQYPTDQAEFVLGRHRCAHSCAVDNWRPTRVGEPNRSRAGKRPHATASSARSAARRNGWEGYQRKRMEGGKIMSGTLQDDMFTPEVIADPYAYYGRLRDEDPVHWNEKYELWVITRHDDLIWLTRHHELFSSAVFKNDPRPAYPAIDESDFGLYEYVRNYQGDQFIQHDRPEHLEMRKVVHGYFTPKSLEEWRPFVQNAVKHLLDE